MILAFGKRIGVETKFEKTACLLGKKIRGLGVCNQCGTDLAAPNIWLFGHFGRKMNYERHTVGFQ